jgi:cob(I)alamin adenosyltransferase
MSNSTSFDDPQRIAINRVYTGKGDSGATSLVGGQKVAKFDPRIEAYGTIDELNSFVGAALCSLAEATIDETNRAHFAAALIRVQHQLFNLGSILATLPEDVHPRQPRIVPDDIAWLEAEMDDATAKLEPLRSFVLPGGCRLNADLHVCRTVSRRAERLVVALSSEVEVDTDSLVYLNRLSDAFFVWSRLASKQLGVDEVLWQPNKAAGDASR